MNVKFNCLYRAAIVRERLITSTRSRLRCRRSGTAHCCCTHKNCAQQFHSAGIEGRCSRPGAVSKVHGGQSRCGREPARRGVCVSHCGRAWTPAGKLVSRSRQRTRCTAAFKGQDRDSDRVHMGPSTGALASVNLAQNRDWVNGTAPLRKPRGIGLATSHRARCGLLSSAVAVPEMKLVNYRSLDEAKATYKEAKRVNKAAADKYWYTARS